jgi:hypothetical protein
MHKGPGPSHDRESLSALAYCHIIDAGRDGKEGPDLAEKVLPLQNGR